MTSLYDVSVSLVMSSWSFPDLLSLGADIFIVFISFSLLSLGFSLVPSHLHGCVPMCFKDFLHARKCALVVVVLLVECIFCTNFIFFLPPKTIPDLCWELAQLQDTYILQGILW
jgi:hypothetical protein